MARRLKGNTATYFFSAWSGLVIKFKDEDNLLVQEFYPSNDDTVYTTPVIVPIEYFEDEENSEEGFRYKDRVYYLKYFLRDNYIGMFI